LFRAHFHTSTEIYRLYRGNWCKRGPW